MTCKRPQVRVLYHPDIKIKITNYSYFFIYLFKLEVCPPRWNVTGQPRLVNSNPVSPRLTLYLLIKYIHYYVQEATIKTWILAKKSGFFIFQNHWQMCFNEYNLNLILLFFLYAMNENLSDNSDQSLLFEDAETPSPEQIILTNKQRLWRLLMITEIKDKSLVPDLIKIKNDMYENFCRTWVWKSEYINQIFRLYANKNQDIKIVKPQLKLFSQYAVSIPNIPPTETLRVTQYIKTLKFIRIGLQPVLQEIQTLVQEAKTYAMKQSEIEFSDTFHTGYDMEEQKQTEHVLVKQRIKEMMSSKSYDQEWFLQEQNIVADTLENHNYQELMLFALLWFHYFERKNDVYDAFLPEQLKTTNISFTLSGFHPTSISLWTFLKIIEHLNFKKHLFSV